MLHWLFGFRGVEGRVRFLAGVSLLMFSMVIVTVAVAVVAGLAHWPGSIWMPIEVAVVFILGNWSLLALGTRRLRDMGWSPILVLGGLIVLSVVEYLSPRVAPAPLGEVLRFPISTLASWALAMALLLWPGCDAEGKVRGGANGAMVVASSVAVVLAGAGLGLIFDPMQGKACPAYGAGAPGDDCESYGVVGRLYSSYLVVDANRRLDAHDPARALKALDKAIAVRPQFVYAFNSLGLAYEQLGDTAKAMAAYDHALALRPEYVNGLTNRAVLLDRLGQRPRALADLQTILRIQPGNVTARAGVTYMTGGR